MSVSFRISGASLLAAAWWACGGGGGGTTQNPTLTVSKVSGDSQVADAGTALASPLVVIVKDDKGNPVSGQSVSWAVASGGGSVTPGGATGADGQASATRTLGPNAGVQTASASVGSSKFTFTNISHIQGATTIAFSGGGGVPDTVKSTVAPYLVLVTDEHNTPVANVTVNWAVTAGGGNVSSASSVTNGSGVAQISHTLGSTAVLNTVQASVTGLSGSPVAFSTSATAGNATTMSLVSGNNQAGPMGGALANPLVVLVKDFYGNPKPGVALTWVNASGSISPASPVTGASGSVAVTRTLGAAPGITTDSVSVTGLAGSPVVFTDTSIFVQDIFVGDDFFNPQTQPLVTGGSYVKWHWTGSRSHNVTWDAGNPASLTNSATQSGGTFLVRLTTSGTYGYHCTIHGSAGSGMFGTLSF